MDLGGTYFITAQQVIEKATIWKTKLSLKLNVQVQDMDVESTHVCTMCTYRLSEEQCEQVDYLSEEENILADDEKIYLIYIAGYIIRKKLVTPEDSFFCYEKYGSYPKQLDRGFKTYQ